MLEITKGTIKNGQPSKTVGTQVIGRRQTEKTHTTIRKQTQIKHEPSYERILIMLAPNTIHEPSYERILIMLVPKTIIAILTYTVKLILIPLFYLPLHDHT